MHATGAEIGSMEPGATGPLIEHHQLLTLFKAPKRRGQRAHIHGLRGDVQQVVQNTADFGIEHPDQARAARHLDPGQLFDGQTPCMFLVHRGHVIQPVEVGQVLQVGATLHQLFGAAMQQTDMRIAPLDQFAVKLQNQTQNPMRRRVLRTEVKVKVADFLLTRERVFEFGAVHYLRPPSSLSRNAMTQSRTSAPSGMIDTRLTQLGMPNFGNSFQNGMMTNTAKISMTISPPPPPMP